MRRASTRAILAACALVAAPPALAADSAELAARQQPVYVTAGLGPNMLGTVALPIRAVRFAESWSRARQDASASAELQRLIAPARNMGRLQKVNYVQAAVHHRIRWMSDATQWGQHDYWASAVQTLERGAGDMEDRAIVKMQALRALGFDPADLFITLGRDRVGGPISVLMVRIEGRFFMVDDTGGPAVPIDRRRFEFQPQISFGWNGTWVHARTVPAATVSAARAPQAR
jgi:predicted transglutaminase-like cysteine proteinase